MSLLNTTVLIDVFSSIPLSFQFRDILYGVEGWVQGNLSGIFPGGSNRWGWRFISKWGEHPDIHLGVSKNRGTPKSSILIGFSIINHPFWGTPIFGNTHLFYCFFLFRLKITNHFEGIWGDVLKYKTYMFLLYDWVDLWRDGKIKATKRPVEGDTGGY